MPRKKRCICDRVNLPNAKFCCWCGLPIERKEWFKGKGYCFFYRKKGKSKIPYSFLILQLGLTNHPFRTIKEAFSYFHSFIGFHDFWREDDWEIILGKIYAQEVSYTSDLVKIRCWWTVTTKGEKGKKNLEPILISVADLPKIR